MKMNCKFIEDNLFAIQESLLPEAEMAQVSEHLSECRNCQAMMSSFSSFTALIEDEKAAGFNAFLGTRILRKLEEHGNPAGHSGMLQLPWLQRPLMAVALIILAVLTGFFAGKQGGSISRQTSRSDLYVMKSDLFISDLNDEDKTIELYK
ncbi:MAG: zf-HC2 domain-containing protein [Bacteroidota bacterium]